MQRKIIPVSEILNDDYPDLDVCHNLGDSINVLQWQCSGELTGAFDRGVKVESQDFINKADAFIELSKNRNVSLVLTPEYSFPYDSLEKVIMNEKLWPGKGKLWCLGTQGENYLALKNRIEEWGKKSNIIVIEKSFELLLEKDFVSPLFYLFKTRSNKLCVIPQFKTGQMSDPSNAFEGKHLCWGKYLFLFNKRDSKNIFLSIICADALHLDVHNFISDVNIKNKYLTIFHPQLNPDPRHLDLQSFRNNLIRGIENLRIITLNWAYDTNIKLPNKLFNIPWSSFYKKNEYRLDKDIKFRENKQKNHKKGTFYSWNNYVEIWFSIRDEHCKIFNIDKSDKSNAQSSVSSRLEPVIEDCFFPEKNKWIPNKTKCCSNVVELYSMINRDKYPFPYPVCNNNSKKCDQCEKSDFFFSSLLGKIEKDEIETTNELVKRILIGSDHHSDSERARKFNLLLTINKNLKSNLIPDALSYIKNNNYEYIVSDDSNFPNIGGDIYNLKPIINDLKISNPEILVVITEKVLENEIEEFYKDLSRRFNARYRDKILIYHNSGGENKFYDKHLEQKKFSNPSFTNNSGKITQA